MHHWKRQYIYTSDSCFHRNRGMESLLGLMVDFMVRVATCFITCAMQFVVIYVIYMNNAPTLLLCYTVDLISYDDVIVMTCYHCLLSVLLPSLPYDWFVRYDWFVWCDVMWCVTLFDAWTEGAWSNNKKHGYGKDHNAAGELLYEGEWIYDKPANP